MKLKDYLFYEEPGIQLFCGDCREILPLLRCPNTSYCIEACDGRCAGFNALVTDPPYSSGGQFRGDRMGSTSAKYVQGGTFAARPEFSGDTRDQRGYLAWCSLWMGEALQIAKPGAAIAIFTDWRQLPTTTDAVQAGGWVWRGVGVWDKTEGSRPRMGGLRSQCEFIVWGTSGPLESERNFIALPGVVKLPTVGDKEHIAEKPLDLLRWLVKLSPADGRVLDPFAGSGTTLVAAKDLGRAAIGIEIEPNHCELTVRRLRQEVLL